MLGIYIRTSREDGSKESPIEQQRAAGIEFAKKNKFQFTVYEDKGISGFKTDKDDLNPFKNRPGFTDMINDIKAGKITKVWVWEHSRLGREGFQMAVINRIFDNCHIRLFEKNKEFNSKDPQEKFLRTILDATAELERHQIVGRTTRGLHHKINQGKRSFGSLYGYKKTGTDNNGYQVLEPVPSEIENIKYAYKRILDGANLRQVTLELHNENNFDKKEALRISRYWYRLVSHFSYTGYELNMAGLEVLKKFNNFEIDSLDVINNEQYYVKSQNYPHKIVNIKNWVKIMEKLRVNREGHHRNKIKSASKDMATGLITCSECGQKYYSLTHKYTRDNKNYEYTYYKHLVVIDQIIKCHAKKTFRTDNIDNIFKLFFFYHYIFFDNTGEMLEEAQRLAKTKIMKLKEQVSKLEKNEKQLRRQIEKLNAAFDGEQTPSETRVLVSQIAKKEDEQKTNYEDLTKAKIELDQLNEQYSENEGMNLHTNAKEKVLNFFKANTEEQRNNLIAIIKNCFIFGTNLLIDTGSTIFVFDTSIKHVFDETLLEGIAQDALYKEHFFGLLKDDEDFIEKDSRTESIKENIFNPSGLYLYECDLSNPKDKKSVLKNFKTAGIKYDISNHNSVVFDLPETL